MLITCPDCRQQISEHATSCPKCGRPVSAVDRAEARAAAERTRTITTGCGIACVAAFFLLVLAFRGCSPGSPGNATSTSSRPGAAREKGVAEYLDEIMAIEGTKEYITRADQPDPDAALVHIDLKGDLPDWQIEKLVRSITEGVHNHSSTGTATVVAQVRGIRVAEGNYKSFSGSIEVRLLR